MTRSSTGRVRVVCLVDHSLVRNASKVEEERLKIKDQDYAITDSFIQQLYPQCECDKCSAKQGH
jgi:hypothetical protein